MNKVNKPRKPRKELPIAVNLILILIFVCVFIYFSINVGFLINSILNYSMEDVIANSFITLLAGIVYMLLLLILIRNSDSENVQPLKWYINCICISFTITFVITALTVFVLGIEEDNDINYLVGFGMFPLIGIITTPNIVRHVKKDTTKWQDIFYNNGNLDGPKETKDYYRVSTPVSFEKKILWAVYKEQFKNIIVVIGVMAIIMGFCIQHILEGHSYSGEVIMDLIEMKIQRSFGIVFFLTLFFIVFGIPIIAYYVTNLWKKIKIVKNHEYIAYHAIVKDIYNGNVNINDQNKHYTYKYCTCVGIKEKDVYNTPATLIFIPDDVLIFPDNEEYKVDNLK